MHDIASGEIPSGIVRGEGGVIGEGRLVGEQKYSLLYIYALRLDVHCFGWLSNYISSFNLIY